MMGRTGRLALAASILGAMGGSACLTTGGYTCRTAADCDLTAAGRCEANGVCSYPSEACDGGHAYSQLGGALAGECVALGGASSTAGPTSTDRGSSDGGPVSGPGDDAATSSGLTGPDASSTSEDCPYFPDADGDSFGLDDAAAAVCVPTEGYVNNRLDCDDTDERINPDGLDCDDNPGMLGWFRFIDGEMWRDSSGKGNDASVLSGSMIEIDNSGGPYGTAAQFDSSEDGLDLGGVAQAFSDDGRFPDAGTLEAWARHEASDPEAGASRFILHFAREESVGFGSPGAQIHLAVNNKQWRWQGWVSVSDGGLPCATEIADDRVSASEEWTHVAFTWALVGADIGTTLECTLYIDGERATGSETPMVTMGSAPVFGAVGRPVMLPGADIERSFTGWIDEIMVFREARSGEQIQSDCGAWCR